MADIIDPSAADDAGGLTPRLSAPFVVLLVVLGGGVVGLRLIEGWTWLEATWMVAITVSTIGFGEIHPLSDAGRMFTIGLIVASFLVFGRAASEVGAWIAEGGLARRWTLRQVRRRMAAMKDHHIVIGYGRLGREIVADLCRHAAPVVVVDPRPPTEAPPDGVTLVVGDATHDPILQAARIDSARGIAIATPSDAVNVYLTLTCRQLNPRAFITVRIEEASALERARRAGADRVLQPYHLSGQRMAQALMRPRSSLFVEHAERRHHDDLLLDDVDVAAGSPACGPIRDLPLGRFGVIAVAVAPRGTEDLQMPSPDLELAAGDTVIVVGPPERVRDFASWAGRA